jgi:argininosuccinate lyase
MIELADEYCRTSVIMPQKKNPYGLSYFRGLTGLLIGRYCSISSIMKSTSGQPDNRIFAHGELPDSFDLCTKGINLFAAIISSLRVNTDICKKQSLAGFSASTDLAEIIMMTQDIDYATTHRLVGSAVRLAIEGGKKTVTITELEEAVRREGIDIDLSKIDFKEINDPTKIVDSRIGLGGAAKNRVLEMIEKEEKKVKRLENWFEEKNSFQNNAIEMLMKNANMLASD